MTLKNKTLQENKNQSKPVTGCRHYSQCSKPKPLLTLPCYSVYVEQESTAAGEYPRAQIPLCPTSAGNHETLHIKAKYIKTKISRPARPGICLGAEMLDSQQTWPVFGFCSFELLQGTDLCFGTMRPSQRQIAMTSAKII